MDDEPSVREAIGGYLGGSGYRCSTAPDAHTALEELRRRDYDLLISDFNMPGLSGEELFSWLGGNFRTWRW